jgi:hypothetical protein
MMRPENDDGRPPPGRSADAEQVVATTNSQPALTKNQAAASDSNGAGRHFHAAGLRRREAALRLPPIGRCGCTRDPELDRHRCGARPLSEKMVDAGAATAKHFLEIGFVPLLELDVLRALYRRGGDDRALARELHELAGGVVG